MPARPRALLLPALLAPFLWIGAPAFGQVDTLSLSLAQAVALAQARHLGLRGARMDTEVQQAAVAREERRFGRALGLSLSHQGTRSPSVSRLEAVQTSTSSGQGLGLSLAQDLATGGSVGLEFRNTRSTSNAAFRLLDPVYQSDLSLRFSQPLLQGRGRVNRTGLELARQSLESSRVGAEGQTWDLEKQVGHAYWALYLARQQALLADQLLAGSERVLESVRARAELGAGARSGILQAQVGVAQRQEEVVVAQGALRQAEDRLKSLIGLDQEPARWGAVPVPVDTPRLGPFSGRLDEGVARAVARDPACRQAELALKGLDLEIALAQDRARPALSVTAQAGLSGIGGALSEDLRGVRQADGRSWQGGLGLTLPLGRTSAQALVRQRQLEQQRKQLGLAQRRLELADQVRTQHRQVGISRQRQEAAGWTRQLAAQSLQEEEERLGLGLSTVRQVLDAQDALAQASQTRLRAVVDYNDALLEWKHLTGE